MRKVETAQEWPTWKRKYTLDHWSEWAEWAWPWENFSPEELACKHCGALVINELAMDALQVTRNIWRRPIIITSGYRCPEHNEAVGGAEDSYHMRGRAFDVQTSHLGPGLILYLVSCATIAGMRGFGSYEGFIHLDNGPARGW